MAVITIQYDPTIDPTAAAAPRGDFPVTPEGRHHLRLSGAEPMAPRPGKEHGKLVIKYEVMKSVGADQTAVGRSRKMFINVSPKANPYFLIPLLQAAGAPFERGKQPTAAGDVDAIQFDTDDLEGAIVEAKCSHDKQGTKTYEDWSDFAVSDMNPRLAAPAPTAQPGPAFASAQARMPAPTGFTAPQPAATVSAAPQGAPPPTRRFG